MGVYIKGMEMPKYYTKMDFGYDADGNPQVIVGEEVYEVILVPPHGRLIDADALKLSHCKECTLYPDKCLEKTGEGCDWGSIYHIEHCAPTIIEAEITNSAILARATDADGGTMAEYIEREKLAEALRIWKNTLIEAYGENDEYVRCLDSVLLGVDNAPAAGVQPVVRGRWINQRADSEMCSACGVRFYISALFAVGGNDEPNFCPNCGARMEES